MLKTATAVWKTIRRLSGDDAYEQYVLHYEQHHSQQHVVQHEDNATQENAAPLLSREEFFKQWQDKKWKGVKRCC